MKKVVTRFVVLMMAFLCGGVHLVPGALALTEEEYKIYAENNIYFYDEHNLGVKNKRTVFKYCAIS